MDKKLYQNFKRELLNNTPQLTKKGTITNRTDLLDISDTLRACATQVFGIDLSEKLACAFGKTDGTLKSGSIKERPATHIIHHAILSGEIQSNHTVIEATSGNFGIAIGELTKIGLHVIVIVSRKLQQGVKDALIARNVKMIDLDIDICPAPGMKGSLEALTARVTAQKIRNDLEEFGYDISIYDTHIEKIEEFLLSQDVINLAQFLAKIFGFFCPRQYHNALNYEAHSTITGPEIDSQLAKKKLSLRNFHVVTTFGTGGTSLGLHKYIQKNYRKKHVHIVFPAKGQDVAGIRGRNNALGLKMYQPKHYRGIYEVDFEQTKLVLQYFIMHGYDIGESSALALYTSIQMANFGIASNLVIMLPDGINKYREQFEKHKQAALEINPEDVKYHTDNCDKLLWIHGQFDLTVLGKQAISDYFKIDSSRIVTPDLTTTRTLLEKKELTNHLKDTLSSKNNIHTKTFTLVLCRSGATSLSASKILSQHNISPLSIKDGINHIAKIQNKKIEDLLKTHIE